MAAGVSCDNTQRSEDSPFSVAPRSAAIAHAAASSSASSSSYSLRAALSTVVGRGAVVAVEKPPFAADELVPWRVAGTECAAKGREQEISRCNRGMYGHRECNKPVSETKSTDRRLVRRRSFRRVFVLLLLLLLLLLQHLRRPPPLLLLLLMLPAYARERCRQCDDKAKGIAER